jgi:hypothetical protein
MPAFTSRHHAAASSLPAHCGSSAGRGESTCRSIPARSTRSTRAATDSYVGSITRWTAPPVMTDRVSPVSRTLGHRSSPVASSNRGKAGTKCEWTSKRASCGSLATPSP